MAVTVWYTRKLMELYRYRVYLINSFPGSGHFVPISDNRPYAGFPNLLTPASLLDLCRFGHEAPSTPTGN
jgi:hypothetical protein